MGAAYVSVGTVTYAPTTLPTNQPTQPTSQPYWSDTGTGYGGYVPARDPVTTSGAPPDCNWEAPLFAWSPWDTGTIGNLRMPGLVRWRVRKEQRIDKKMTAGSSGATPTALGFSPAEVDLTFQMWTKAHLRQYEELTFNILSKIASAQALQTAKKGSAQDARALTAFDIYLPALNIVGITSLYILMVGVPEPTGTPQVLQATFKFQEFSPIKSTETAQKITGSQPDFSGIKSPLVSNTANVPVEPNTKSASFAP